jgi:uncharacterized protein (DUF885 family)
MSSLLLLALLACGPKAPPAPPVPEAPAPAVPADPAGAAEGVQDPALADLLIRHWDHQMAASPVWATRLGDRRFDDTLGDATWAAAEADLAATRGFLSEAQALRERGGLAAADALTLDVFLLQLQQGVDEAPCRFHAWSISPRFNALVDIYDLPEAHPVRSAEDARNLLARYRAAPGRIAAEAARLSRGATEGRAAPAETLRRTLAQADEALARPVDASPLLAPLERETPGLSEAERAAWQADMRAAVVDGIRPALVAWRDRVRAEVLPAGRAPEQAGLRFLPYGEACYGALVRRYTTLDRTPEQVHQAGLDAIAAVHQEFRTLGPSTVGTDDLPGIFRALREDPALRFGTAEEVEAAARTALAEAQAAVPAAFGRLPEAPCEVRPIPAHEAPYTTIAYYQPSEPGGGRPGVYFINTHAPDTRPRFEARALAVHEAVPGHHFQIAIAQELPALPAFRKHAGMTAFVEGWALYSERLADELGLYPTDVDRLGMLSFDAWRAARLVVDTGVHHMGWTRAQAEDWMRENTPLADNNIVNEVDRYVSWPGQAVAYKTGQIEILALRAEAEAALGARFDRAAFHDVVLGAGAVPLPVLRARVEAWVASAQQAEPAGQPAPGGGEVPGHGEAP